MDLKGFETEQLFDHWKKNSSKERVKNGKIDEVDLQMALDWSISKVQTWVLKMNESQFLNAIAKLSDTYLFEYLLLETDDALLHMEGGFEVKTPATKLQTIVTNLDMTFFPNPTNQFVEMDFEPKGKCGK